MVCPTIDPVAEENVLRGPIRVLDVTSPRVDATRRQDFFGGARRLSERLRNTEVPSLRGKQSSLNKHEDITSMMRLMISRLKNKVIKASVMKRPTMLNCS